jgi:hypothetical protein
MLVGTVIYPTPQGSSLLIDSRITAWQNRKKRNVASVGGVDHHGIGRVCGISSLRASSYSTKVQTHTTKGANQWAYFKSRSIKEHNFTFTRDIMAALEVWKDRTPLSRNFCNRK